MDFLSPISLLFLITFANVDLNQMDDHMAGDLSGNYVNEQVTESIQANPCPQSFDIQVIATDDPNIFFLRKKSRFKGSQVEAQRFLPIDGQPHLLFNGELIKAMVIDEHSIQIEVFNQVIPDEKVVETFTFDADGTLTYKSKHFDDGKKGKTSSSLCKEAVYKSKEE